MSWWLLVPIAYLLGSIPFALVVTRRVAGLDVRAFGSGNVGATNVLRTTGTGVAAMVLLLDIGKGALPVVVGNYLGVPPMVVGTAAIAAVLGHVYPVFSSFRGGKGVATAAGGFGALAMGPALASLAVFVIVVAWTRYASLGSMAAAVSFPVLALLFVRLGWMPQLPNELLICSVLVAALIIVRHRGNVRRLIEGGESRLGERVEVKTE
jgi:glycerol-3-phosphate acyltransferase PlsY